MRRRRRKNDREGEPPKQARVTRPIAMRALVVVGCVLAFFGAWFGLNRLDQHVDRLLLRERPDPTVEFVDLPRELYALANHDLHRGLFDVLGREWTDEALCRDVATRLRQVGWVARVNHVRRTGGGRLEISCTYRSPAALVMEGENGYLIDGEAVRLPGTYVAHPAWRRLEGVAKDVPAPGAAWEGDDIRAGLEVLAVVTGEPYSDQIAGVCVENFAGRRDPRGSHIELLTDRPGGRIRWGSAPGLELEENGVPQKLALLRENFGRTGRVDAQHAVIDISVFPDRFTVPG